MSNYIDNIIVTIVEKMYNINKMSNYFKVCYLKYYFPGLLLLRSFLHLLVIFLLLLSLHQ